MAEDKPKKKTTNNKSPNKVEQQFSTHTGHPLTPKEAKFIDEYVRTSNGKQAVEEAGYSGKPSTFAQVAYRLLSKDYIAEEINYRLEKAKNESIADATEIMQYFTDVMRGKINDQFGLEASLSERTKAAQELAKRQIDIPQRLQGNEQPKLVITVDWGENASADVDMIGESVDTETIQKAFDTKPQTSD